MEERRLTLSSGHTEQGTLGVMVGVVTTSASSDFKFSPNLPIWLSGESLVKVKPIQAT